MNGLPAIADLKIDISIKNRKRMKKLNQRHQSENPVGDKFSVPDKCKKLHHSKSKNSSCKKFECYKITHEDVLTFRSRLYQSIERSVQQEFLYNFMTTNSVKSHRSSKLQAIRLMTVYYYLQKKDSDERIQVCRDMFQAATGLTTSKTKAIYTKFYKKKLLLKGHDDLKKTVIACENPEIEEKFRMKLAQKKEELLSLEKGTFETFVKAISGKDNGNSETESPQRIKRKYTKKKREIKKKPRNDEENEFEQDQEEQDEIFEGTERVFLDLNALETCRICLQSDGNGLIGLYKKTSSDCSAAQMLRFSFSMKCDPSDQFPKKICQNCFQQLKDAYQLKINCLESLKIMRECVNQNDSYDCLENSEPDAVEIYKTRNPFLEEKEEEEEEKEEQQMEPEYLEEEFLEDDDSLSDFMETPQPVINNSNMQPKKCYLCNVDFESTPEDHFSTVHNLIQSARCTKCEFETEFPWFMNLHYQLHEESFKLCPYCGKRYEPTGPEKFSAHKTRCKNRTNPPKRYECQYCNATFANKNYISIHIRQIHTGEKPYQCSECSERLGTKIALRRHLFIKHGIGASCSCSKCGKPYLQRYEMMRHQKYCLRQ